MKLIFDFDRKRNIVFFLLLLYFAFLLRKKTHKLNRSFFLLSCLIGRRKPASVRPRGEGVYVAEFTPQVEGSHRIDVDWSDQPIRQR